MRGAYELKASGSAPGGRGQRGIVVVVVAISLFAIISIGALALDVSHAMVNKTRLQNTVDAAALSAAKTLDQSGSTEQARDAATAVFQDNAEGTGNKELGEFFAGGGTLRIEFSNTLYPFAPGTAPAQYARVAVDNFPLQTWIAGAIGITEKSVAATAVSGPSPPFGAGDEVCNLAPVMVCGDPTDPPNTHFGYVLDAVQVLKTSTTNGTWNVGPGNFQLIRLDGGQGAADVREALAGGFDGCETGDEPIQTEPGNSVGPVVQGLNTRFGQYSGPMHGTEQIYPPDVITTANTRPIVVNSQGQVVTQPGDLTFNHSMYAGQAVTGPYNYQPAPDGLGHFDRRTLAVPIGDCSGTVNGAGQVPLLGYSCFFLLQPAVQQGNRSQIYGQFIESCEVAGVPGPDPGGGAGGEGEGPHTIQLYEDPNSSDS
jgi:hypothetical protein